MNKCEKCGREILSNLCANCLADSWDRKAKLRDLVEKRKVEHEEWNSAELIKEQPVRAECERLAGRIWQSRFNRLEFSEPGNQLRVTAHVEDQGGHPFEGFKLELIHDRALAWKALIAFLKVVAGEVP